MSIKLHPATGRQFYSPYTVLMKLGEAASLQLHKTGPGDTVIYSYLVQYFSAKPCAHAVVTLTRGAIAFWIVQSSMRANSQKYPEVGDRVTTDMLCNSALAGLASTHEKRGGS